MTYSGWAQRTVTGSVTDATDPLPGVSVVVKGTTSGTVTDIDGRYSIQVPDENSQLVFSFVGYGTQEITVGNQSSIDVTLQTDAEILDEVVVVGYGTQRREAVTGAVSSVKSTEIEQLSVTSVGEAVQGRLAGVSVVNNGPPGADPIIRVRGIGSISYASDPLIVIDGFPTGGLNLFDTRDIQSVDVLKDASSAAIYGSRAANGVILITTKKGNETGGLKVNFHSTVGAQNAWRQLDLLNTEQYVQYARALVGEEGLPERLRPENFNQPIYEGARQTYAETDTDWQDAVFQTGLLTHSHLSVSGGTETSRVYASLGYFKQDGIMIGTPYERYNFRINSDYDLGSKFTFGQTLLIATDKVLAEANAGGRTQVKNIVHNIPYIPVEDPTLPGGYRAPDNSDSSDPENPVRAALLDTDTRRNVRLFGTLYGEYRITEDLSLRGMIGGNFNNFRRDLILPIYFDGFSGRPENQLTNEHTQNFSPIYSAQLKYNRILNDHSIDFVAVAERQSGYFNRLQGSVFQASNEVDQLNGGFNQTTTGNRSETHIISYVGRLNYSYAGKYLLTASFRRDGSSVFAPDRQWGNFPAVGVGWRISEEPFLANNPTISELKLRGSYGLIGFNGVPAYSFQQLINTNANPILGGEQAPTGFTNQLANTELEWEITKMLNIGFDLGLYNNRLQFSAEIYDRRVDNLILAVPLAPSLGYSASTVANVGEMRNWGYEFQLGYIKPSGRFTWDVQANLSIARNEVVSLATPASTIFSGGVGDYGGFDITLTEAGRAIQSFFGWQTDGLFQSQAEIDAANALDGEPSSPYQPNAEPGDIRFVDINGDGVITPDDRTFLGSFIPDFTYGLNLNAKYDNFDFSLFLQGVQGNEIYNGVKVLQQGMLRLFGAGVEVLDAWTPQNTDTSIPRAVDGDPNQNTRTSDRFIEDGSYMRIKNLTIGYTVPFASGGPISKLRLYISGQNLVTLTGYTGYDPEIGSRFNNLLNNGIDYGQYPAARTFLFGVQASF